ncbi:short-chain dehydrogenase [Fictibacillus sp. Mic-4]|uniref:short-chain dehydrogenase n=1 Tax=Fictibacillus sp. Mic-4 TaxID=3132826 RepID=UPI003CEE816F
MRKHALVVGGTGMLQKVCLWLENEGYHVSVIGRRNARLKELVEKASSSEKITPISVDYHDGEKFKAELNKTMEKNGPVDIAVAWIHSTAPEGMNILETTISSHAAKKWELFHIKGSAASRIPRTDLSTSQNCDYRQIILGFILDGDSSRWLTNNEIAEGVIRAISRKEKLHIVGVVEPWDKRP